MDARGRGAKVHAHAKCNDGAASLAVSRADKTSAVAHVRFVRGESVNPPPTGVAHVVSPHSIHSSQ